MPLTNVTELNTRSEVMLSFSPKSRTYFFSHLINDGVLDRGVLNYILLHSCLHVYRAIFEDDINHA